MRLREREIDLLRKRNLVIFRPRQIPRATATLLALALASAAPSLSGSDAMLRMAVVNLPSSFGDPFRAVGIPGDFVWRQIFDSLTESGEDGRIAPLLARRWENPSPCTWRFELREGVRFSNGRSFNAEAAGRVLRWLMSAEGQATVAGSELRGLLSVEAPGSHTLVVTTKTPDPILPNRLAVVMMIDPQAFSELGRQGFSRQPVGTGSYIVEDWQNRNGALLLTPNPHAWRPPRTPQVEVYPLRDHASRFQAALSGQLDIAMSLRPEQLQAFAERGFTTHIDSLRQITSLAFDVTGHADTPIGDVRVRQALNHAVNRKALSDDIMAGFAPPASQGSSPGVFGHNRALKPYPFDPQKARALLAAAGYPQGFSMEVQVVTGTYSNDLEVFAKVQQDLAAVGVTATFRATLFSDWIRQYVQGAWRSEAFSIGWNTAPHNDALRPMEYFSCLKNRPFFCDESLNEPLAAAAREMDPARREAMLQDLAIEYRNRAPSLLLLQYGHIWVVSREVRGFRLRARVPQLYRMELAR